MEKIEYAMGSISDELLEEALAADSAEKLARVRRAEGAKRRRLTIRCLSALAACVCLCFCAAAVYRNIASRADGRLEIASPVTEVESAEEMVKYLGFDIPVLADKSVDSYMVYSDGKYAYRGEISYSDGSSFCAEKGSGDISGIYGGTLQGSQTISGINVYFYSMEDTRYAIWSDGGISCCYCASADEANYSNQIAELISAGK